MDLSLFLSFKICRKLDIDGRCSELQIDFYKNTSIIIEMLAIKVGTPSYLELYMKREREEGRGIDRDKDGDRDKRMKTVICTITALKQNKLTIITLTDQ